MNDGTTGELDKQGSATVDKAINVLTAVADSPGGLTNAELGELLGLDRSAVHRLVSTLRRRGLVRRVGTPARLVVGSRLHYLAWGPVPDLRLVLEPIMAELVALTGESASFCVRNDDSFYCVAHAPSPHELRYSPTTGGSYPLNSGAAGLAIWAFLPQAERTQLLTEHEFPSFTDATITARSELEAELDNTRARGYGMSAGVRTPGGCSIAFPVLDRHETAAGALALSAAELRMPIDRLREYAPALRAGSIRLARAMGWQDVTT